MRDYAMMKLATSILLLLTMSALIAAQPEPQDTEPPAPVSPAISPQASSKPPEAEPPAQIEPAAAQPDAPSVLTVEVEAEPPAPVQPVVIIRYDTLPCPEPVKAKPLLFEYGRSNTAARIQPPPHSSAFVFPAGFVTTSARGGYRKYDGVNEHQYVERNGMFMYGGVAGKRFALKNRTVRFQAAVEAVWGSKEEDAYEYESGNTVEEAHEYVKLSAFGIQTDMHILFPDKTRAYFLSIGPGLHRSSFSFSLRGSDNHTLWKGENMSTVSPSFNVGAGTEYTLNQYRAMAVAYNFRIWSPINYMETGDLFPMGVRYHEIFYTHSLHVQILLPGTKKGRFR